MKQAPNVPQPELGFLREILSCVDAVRRAQGLSSLRHSATLTRAAEQQLSVLSSRPDITHEGLEGVSFDRRLALAGCIGFTARECIGRNFLSPPQLVTAWQHSPSHARNLLWDGATIGGLALGTVYERRTGLHARICVFILGQRNDGSYAKYASSWTKWALSRRRYARAVSTLQSQVGNDRICVAAAVASKNDFAYVCGGRAQ